MDTQQRKADRARRTKAEGRHFVGEWKVVANTPVAGEEEWVRIRPVQGGQYELYELAYKSADASGWRVLQKLVYMADTGTLENRVDADGLPPLIPGSTDPEREPERCLSFWNRRVRNRQEQCSIFAIRIGKNPPAGPGEADCPLPPSEEGDNGSWGAEEGG